MQNKSFRMVNNMSKKPFTHKDYVTGYEYFRNLSQEKDKRIKELKAALNKLHRCTCTRSWPRAGRHEESCQEYIIEQVLEGGK